MTRKYWWAAFISFSTLLLAAYALGVSDPQIKTFLEGLSSIKHFSIHYVVAIFTAMLVCIAWVYKTKRRALEPLILLATVFVSHFPDFRFAFRKQAHDPWEVIFLGHTIVDDKFFPLFYILLPATVSLVFYYLHLLKNRPHNDI